MHRNRIIAFLLFTFLFAIAFGMGAFFKEGLIIPESSKYTKSPQPTPLSIYNIKNLQYSYQNNLIKEGEITFGDKFINENKFNSNLFYFKFYANPQKEEISTTSGVINIPNNEGKYPLVIMLRGYVDQEIYESGMGTKNASGFFAENGFITVAPDFLGYGSSSENSADIFESRFQTYTLVLSLLKSIKQIEPWDQKNVFIWSHSNGGQIALTTLEITQQMLPTSLWAPVSKPFPYSILYYTDESEDKGKLIRQKLSQFESIYDANQYSLTNYFDNITAPIIIHQGTADDAVPLDWSLELKSQLEIAGVKIIYNQYTNSDHNLRPAWNEVILKDLEFFNSFIDN